MLSYCLRRRLNIIRTSSESWIWSSWAQRIIVCEMSSFSVARRTIGRTSTVAVLVQGELRTSATSFNDKTHHWLVKAKKVLFLRMGMACRQVEDVIRRHRCEPYYRKRIGGGYSGRAKGFAVGHLTLRHWTVLSGSLAGLSWHYTRDYLPSSERKNSKTLNSEFLRAPTGCTEIPLAV